MTDQPQQPQPNVPRRRRSSRTSAAATAELWRSRPAHVAAGREDLGDPGAPRARSWRPWWASRSSARSIVFLIFKDRGPFVRFHAAQALNFQIIITIALLGLRGCCRSC